MKTRGFVWFFNIKTVRSFQEFFLTTQENYTLVWRLQSPIWNRKVISLEVFGLLFESQFAVLLLLYLRLHKASEHYLPLLQNDTKMVKK